MCGIGGYVDFERGADSRILQAMAHSLRRRGPDAQSFHAAGACGLAHGRLSIIDIAGSPQPMLAEDLGRAIVYNGEIYNYERLRGELKAEGVDFRTRGDTEVVLRGAATQGVEFLPRLDGMFAFGLWNERTQELLMARDAIGEKPLFYATPRPGLIVFGSEIKTILAHPEVKAELEADALRQALRFRAVYGDKSLYAGVRQVEPGGWLVFSREGVRTGRFHDLAASAAEARGAQRGKDEATLVREGYDLFVQSVEERLVGEVPVGAFLSGGLDSSLIVAAMRMLRPKAEIRTYSVGFEGDPHSELPFAQLVADRIGSTHTAVHVGAADYIRRFAELAACRDAPVSQPADIAIAEMSRIAKQHVTVALSGEGADEIFAGYPKYGMARIPRAFGAALGLVGPERVSAIAGALGVDRRRTLVAARALALPDEVDRFAQWFSYLGRTDLADLLPGLGWDDAAWRATTAEQSRVLAALAAGDNLLRMQMTDCLTWLPSNMLERGDRMTMAEGLEVRPPFLDKALCAYGLALPHALKVRGRTGKWVVRQWAAQLVPQDVIDRRKWGFRTPLEDWFRGPMKTFLTDYLMSDAGLCAAYGDRRAIRGLLDAHMAGRVDAGEALWTLLSAEVWYQDVFRGRPTDDALAA